MNIQQIVITRFNDSCDNWIINAREELKIFCVEEIIKLQTLHNHF